MLICDATSQDNALLLGIALVLAGVGLYGVISYSVSQSKRELGSRMALGAGAIDVFRTIMVHGLLLAAGGVVLGSIAAMFLTRFIDTGNLAVSSESLQPGDFCARVAGDGDLCH